MLRAALFVMFAGSSVAAQTEKPEAIAQANLGVSQAQKANYRDAVESYKRAIAIDPNLPGIYMNLGLAWFKLGNFRQAIAAFDK
jgi:tetratricopeptide (TPR) repeat protein